MQMRARRQKQDLRTFSPMNENDMGVHPNADIPTPTSAGDYSTRRIVKSLKSPPACITQLMPLDSQPHQSRRISSIVPSMPSEGSVSEVRSELCSAAVDDQGDISTTSFLDHRRARQTCKASTGRSDRRKSKPASAARWATGSRHNNVAARESVHDTDESTILSYSDSGSFYSCGTPDSGSSSHSARSASSGSCRSVSYTAISESVPSCSLTVMGDQTIRVPVTATWGGRKRRNPPPAGRKHSDSFGSLFGGAIIDPYDGTSTNSHHTSTGVTSAPSTAHNSTAQAVGGGPSGKERPTAAAEVDSSSNALAATQRPRLASPRDAAKSPEKKAVEAAATPGNAAALSVAGDAPTKDVTTAQSEPTTPGEGPTDIISTETALSSPAAGADDTSEENPPWRVQSAKKEVRIGRGSYGDVYRGTDLETGRVIAIKEILVPKDFTKDLEKQLQVLEREIRVMRKLHHPNIINYLGAAREDSNLNIYMEYVAGGTVGELLRSEGALSEARTRSYTAQLLCGLEYLHERQIVHRDLKGDNLFLGDGDVLKVGDFGTSKELATTLVTDSVAGTPNFMAPEVIACSGHSYAADIWSVGCCVLEMLTGMPPFAKLDNHMAVMFAVMKGRLEEQVPDHISGGAKDFIKVCTQHDPKDRWTVTQLRTHPWLLGKTDAPPADTSATGAGASPADTATPPPAGDAEKMKSLSPRAGRAKAGTPTTRDGAKSKESTKKRAASNTSSTPKTPAPGSAMPALVGRKGKSAAPLDTCALSKTAPGLASARGGGPGTNSGAVHLPAAAKSPAPGSDDGDVGGATSSEPSTTGNSPSSRSKARTKKGHRDALPLDLADVSPSQVSPPLRMTLASTCNSGRPPVHGNSSPRALVPRRPSPLASSNQASPVHGSPRTNSGSTRATTRGATSESPSASAPSQQGSVAVIATPPSGTPTVNPRRSIVSSNSSGLAPSPSPRREKKKKKKLSN